MITNDGRRKYRATTQTRTKRITRFVSLLLLVVKHYMQSCLIIASHKYVAYHKYDLLHKDESG